MKNKSYEDEIIERSRKDSDLPNSEFAKSVYDLYCVPLEMYQEFKDKILRLSLSYQKWTVALDSSTILLAQDQLTDKQIARKLGLTEDQVMRIRCMAEWDIPMEVWRNAAEFKRRSRLKKPLGAPRREIRTEPG